MWNVTGNSNFFLELLLHCYLGDCFIVCCLHAWPLAHYFGLNIIDRCGEEWKDMHKGDKTAPLQPVNNNHNAPSTYESTWVEEPSLWWQVPIASLDPASVRPLSRPPWGRTESVSHTTWYAQTPGSLPVNVNITKLQHGPEHCAHVTNTLLLQTDWFAVLNSPTPKPPQISDTIFNVIGLCGSKKLWFMSNKSVKFT